MSRDAPGGLPRAAVVFAYVAVVAVVLWMFVWGGMRYLDQVSGDPAALHGAVKLLVLGGCLIGLFAALWPAVGRSRIEVRTHWGGLGGGLGGWEIPAALVYLVGVVVLGSLFAIQQHESPEAKKKGDAAKPAAAVTTVAECVKKALAPPPATAKTPAVTATPTVTPTPPPTPAPVLRLPAPTPVTPTPAPDAAAPPPAKAPPDAP